MSELPEGAYESMQRIAQHCANTWRGDGWHLTGEEKYDAALDGIVGHVAECGWPRGPLKDVFRAGSAGIGRAADEAARHLRFMTFWTEPRGSADSLAEAVTDRIGVRQLVRVLPHTEWEAVWALSEVLKRDGGYRDGAAMIGISDAAMSTRLARARKYARELWVAPGEHPVGQFRAEPSGRRHKFAAARYNRKYKKAAA